MNGKSPCTAIVLAAGQGKRMHSSIQKQFLELDQKPVIVHTLSVFEHSPLIDAIILVVEARQREFVKSDIVEKYGISKVKVLAEGGQERYHSVWNGLNAMQDYCGAEGWSSQYIFIHDGARPFVDDAMLNRLYQDVKRFGTSVAGMPSKDTVKIVDEQCCAVHTPERRMVWLVQTPQVFEAALIMEAYRRMMSAEQIDATDDAMAVERYMKVPVRMTEGSYRNIKITTPEDLEIAAAFIQQKK